MRNPNRKFRMADRGGLGRLVRGTFPSRNSSALGVGEKSSPIRGQFPVEFSEPYGSLSLGSLTVF